MLQIHFLQAAPLGLEYKCKFVELLLSKTKFCEGRSDLSEIKSAVALLLKEPFQFLSLHVGKISKVNILLQGRSFIQIQK